MSLIIIHATSSQSRHGQALYRNGYANMGAHLPGKQSGFVVTQDVIGIASVSPYNFRGRGAVTPDPLCEYGVTDLAAPLQQTLQPLQALAGNPLVT